MSMKNSNGTIGNRTRDLPVSCLEVPGSYICIHIGYFKKFKGLGQRIRNDITWHLLLDS